MYCSIVVKCTRQWWLNVLFNLRILFDHNSYIINYEIQKWVNVQVNSGEITIQLWLNIQVNRGSMY